MRTRTLFRYALLAFASAAVACGVHQQETPSLTGPSEFALSVSVTALPDSINQDGGSQSSIRVTAHDANGQPINGQTFRLDIMVSGSEVDFGTLSARTVVTGSDGTAFAVYTAPPAPPNGSTVGTCGALAGACVSIAATPTGSNFSASQTQSVLIHLTVPGTILPPAASPTAAFTVTPTPVGLNVATNFDASASCGGAVSGGTCDNTNPITSYAWTFGDGASGSGRTTPHTYTAAGTFSVTLTVTNSRGLSSSTTQSVSTVAGSAPTADFSFSPAAPVVSDQVQFDADGSRAAAGRTIVQYSWNFGDPTSSSNTASDLVPTHKFLNAGTYTVVLTVRDDADQKTTTSKPVTIGTGNPVPVITSSPSAPVHAVTSVSFSSAGSTTSGGATITNYAWDFGDGSTAITASPSHTYGSAGAFTVRLTITDSQGRVGTTTATVTVS
jgi:PKD repeat protein